MALLQRSRWCASPSPGWCCALNVYMIQAAGVEAGFAGNVVQLAIFMGICLGYVSTYILRVANKVILFTSYRTRFIKTGIDCMCQFYYINGNFQFQISNLFIQIVSLKVRRNFFTQYGYEIMKSKKLLYEFHIEKYKERIGTDILYSTWQ